MKIWRPKGNFEVLGKRHRKSLISQTFENADNPKETIDWTLFLGEKKSSLIFALTDDLEVILIKQYRFGSSRVEKELAGGNIEEGENAEEAARRELEEETGFRPQKMVRLAPKSALWIEPSCFYQGYNFPWLAVDCTKVSNQKLDQNESLDIELVPLRQWIDYINTGVISDSKTIAMTCLSLLHLDLLKLQI
ncbi:MAG: NUDIX domain-containing protein [Patescibacteria group bacterium]